MVHAIWTYILETCGLWNKHLHQDNGYLSQPHYQQAVTTFYETGHQLPPAVREAIFQKPLHIMLEQPPAVLCTWLECTNLYMKQQMTAGKTCARLNTPDICSFLNPNLSQRMTCIHLKKPCYTAPVWVFFVLISLRVITLKKQVFYNLGVCAFAPSAVWLALMYLLSILVLAVQPASGSCFFCSISAATGGCPLLE